MAAPAPAASTSRALPAHPAPARVPPTPAGRPSRSRLDVHDGGRRALSSASAPGPSAAARPTRSRRGGAVLRSRARRRTTNRARGSGRRASPGGCVHREALPPLGAVRSPAGTGAPMTGQERLCARGTIHRGRPPAESTATSLPPTLGEPRHVIAVPKLSRAPTRLASRSAIASTADPERFVRRGRLHGRRSARVRARRTPARWPAAVRSRRCRARACVRGSLPRER